jgi:predicted alpha/beta-fold hydrolase
LRSRAPLSGIVWTVGPAAVARFFPPATSRHEPFEAAVDDALAGRVAIRGALHAPPGADHLIVGLHGLGGSIESSYLRRLAAGATAAGFAFLRLNLRGADRRGEDFYHAGLTADLDAVLASPVLDRFERRSLVGFSLGGHVALRWAGERGAAAASRVEAIAAVCAPLDLDRGARALDNGGSRLYLRHVLRGLNEQIDAVEKRAAATARPLVHVDRRRRLAARSIREWDGLVVAPRWGFASAEEYYERASAAPLLGRIAVPTWIVESEADPMVPPWTVVEALAGISATTEVTWTERGGHVGMPGDLDLGRPGARGLTGQLLSWIRDRTSAPAAPRR